MVLTGQNNVTMTSGSVIVTDSNSANNADFGLNALLTVCTASSVRPDASSTPKPKVANQYDVLNVPVPSYGETTLDAHEPSYGETTLAT